MLGTRFEEYPECGDKLPFKLMTGIRRTAAIFSAAANWHENLELEFCTGGRGYVLLDGRRIDVSEGDIVVVNSNVVHYTATDTSLEYACMIVAPGFCRDADVDTSELVFRERLRSERVSELFRELTEIYAGSDVCRTAKLQIVTLQILSELREKYAEAENPRAASSPEFETVKRAIKFIRENYREKLSLELISKNAYVNKYALSRGFKAFTGQTVFQYINNFRCGRVNELMSAGSTVNEAARLCGFGNMSFFTRMYRKMNGQLPSEYRKACGRNAAGAMRSS